MKQTKAHLLMVAGAVALALTGTAGTLFGQILPVARYEGRWEIQSNGDVKVTREFKLPMQLYRMWKAADIHMLEYRSFAAERSSVEVADKNADWDDANRTLTLTMTVLGLARNMATHWEGEVPLGEDFSNLDETKKIAYFHFSVDGPMGRVQGQDQIVLPPECSQLAWDASKRTITYVMPKPVAEAGGSTATVWWALFGLCLVVGIGAWAASFVFVAKPAASTSPPAD